MSTSHRRAAVAILAALVAISGLAACGDDDAGPTDQPPLTNELGVETFEPGDDPFDLPETLEPDDGS
jgi:hypothetical protein